jgi:hypothetical protein
MLNEKQKSLTGIAVSKTLEQGSGIQIADRPLRVGEFSPIMSKNQSGGVVFSKESVPPHIAANLGVAFLPVVDHEGKEQLALCLHGENYKLVVLARLAPTAAAGLVGDLMMSASHYSDPVLQAEVVKTIGDHVIASDMAIKDGLVLNTEAALQGIFAKMVARRLESQQKTFDAAVAEIERKAVIKAQEAISKSLLELAEVAAIDQTSVRHARLSELLPTIKSMLVTK